MRGPVSASCYAQQESWFPAFPEAVFVYSPLVDVSTRLDALNGQHLTLGLLAAGLAAPVVFAPFVFWAGWITPGYSHISSTFSDAAAQGQPHPEVMGAGLLLLGFLLGFFAAGCHRVFPRHNRRVAAAVLVTAIAIAGTGMFHDYNRAPYVPHNTEGFLHNAFAVIAILSATTAILLSGIAAHRQPGWGHLLLPAIGFALASAACGYLFQTVSDTRDGLAERGFAAVALGWMVIIALTAIWSIEEVRTLRAFPVMLPEPAHARDQSTPHDRA